MGKFVKLQVSPASLHQIGNRDVMEFVQGHLSIAQVPVLNISGMFSFLD